VKTMALVQPIAPKKGCLLMLASHSIHSHLCIAKSCSFKSRERSLWCHRGYLRGEWRRGKPGVVVPGGWFEGYLRHTRGYRERSVSFKYLI
jgi:hypothetical protein